MHKRFYSSDPADTLDWNKVKSVEGEIMSIRTTKVQGRPTSLMVIEQKGGRRVTVWQTAGLVELFENAGVGDKVKIVKTGTVKLDAKRTMRNFDVDLWTAEAKAK